MAGRKYESIFQKLIKQPINDVIIQQLIRNETEFVAKCAKCWKHDLENDILLNSLTPDLMYQTIILLLDCFINGINNNKKRAQCLMKKIKKIMNEKMDDYFEMFSENDDDYISVNVNCGSSDVTVKFKKDDSKFLEMINETKKKEGFDVTIGNDFCYKSVMDRMKKVHDELEIYNDYLYVLTGEIDKVKM